MITASCDAGGLGGSPPGREEDGGYPGSGDQRELRQITADWISDLEPWASFNTLTFDWKKFKREIMPDVAFSYWRRLVQVLNRDAFGKNYLRRVGHSYFSYVLAMEYQKRGVIHFHFLVDQPLNFDLVHAWWGQAAGFAWLGPIDDLHAAALYATKYMLKEDCSPVRVYCCLKKKTPLIGRLPPAWWVT